jgi:hypothetical protein
MQKSITQISLLSVVTAITISLSGCGVTKVVQCNSMVKIVNDAAAEGQSFAKAAGTADPANATQLFTGTATKLEKLGKDMEVLDIKDEKLQGMKGKFITMYKAASKGLLDASAAVKAKDAKAMTKALEDIKNGTSQEDSLVKDINAYCAGK